VGALPIDLVLNPVDATWDQVVEVARAAEGAGYSGLWVLDHVSGTPFGAATTMECFTLLGALAVAVPRLPVGPLVVNAAARPVAVTGLALETIGRIAGDRLRIGIGAGAGTSGPFAVEHEVLGRPAGPLVARHRRVHHVLDDVSARPSLAGVPVIVGANSPALAGLAGRHADGLNIGVDHPDRAALISAARSATPAEPGRSFEVSAWARWRPALTDPAHADRVALARSGVARLMLALRPAEITAADLPPAG